MASSRRNLLRAVEVESDQARVAWFRVEANRAFLLHEREAALFKNSHQLRKLQFPFTTLRRVANRLIGAAKTTTLANALTNKTIQH